MPHRGTLTSVTSTSAPAHLGCQADEFIGKTSTGYSQVGVAFQEGDVIAVVLVVDSAATVNPGFAEAVALAQDQKIVGSHEPDVSRSGRGARAARARSRLSRPR